MIRKRATGVAAMRTASRRWPRLRESAGGPLLCTPPARRSTAAPAVTSDLPQPPLIHLRPRRPAIDPQPPRRVLVAPRLRSAIRSRHPVLRDPWRRAMLLLGLAEGLLERAAMEGTITPDRE